MSASVWRRRGLVRGAGLLLFALICGFEWFMMLVAVKNPLYTGPAQPGRRIPPFATALADGMAFSDRDLAKGTPSVLVFFRGRW